MLPRSLVRPTSFIAAVFIACAGTSCPVPSIGIDCSNNLNASEFGFTAVVPPEFVCTTVIPNPELLLSVRYVKSVGNLIAAILVGPNDLSDTTSTDQITQTELDQLVNPNGVTFRRFKVTFTGATVTSFLGLVTLPSGNQLGVTMAAATDDPALLENLNAILNSVVLVNP